MTELPTRRDAVLATALIAAVAGAAPTGVAAAAATGHEHDWDWFIGEWKVRHRYLKARLGGSGEWLEFDGTTSFRTIMGGLANLDDNVLNKPDGTYRAATVRASTRKTVCGGSGGWTGVTPPPSTHRWPAASRMASASSSARTP